MNARSLRERDGWRSFRSALASIWRMRSRVTANDWPTSSSVCSLPSSRPKRILMTFSSHVLRTLTPREEKVIKMRFGLVLQVDVDHRFGRRDHGTVFDEVAKVRIFLFANRRFERDRLLSNLQDFPDFRDRNVHALGNFF